MHIRSPLQIGEDARTAGCATRHVVTHVSHPGRTLLQGQQRVEPGHPVRLGRGNAETLAYVVEGALAYPPDRVLRGMQCR